MHTNTGVCAHTERHGRMLTGAYTQAHTQVYTQTSTHLTRTVNLVWTPGASYRTHCISESLQWAIKSGSSSSSTLWKRFPSLGINSLRSARLEKTALPRAVKAAEAIHKNRVNTGAPSSTDWRLSITGPEETAKLLLKTLTQKCKGSRMPPNNFKTNKENTVETFLSQF